jgi:hypothetical protein
MQRIENPFLISGWFLFDLGDVTQDVFKKKLHQFNEKLRHKGIDAAACQTAARLFGQVFLAVKRQERQWIQTIQQYVQSVDSIDLLEWAYWIVALLVPTDWPERDMMMAGLYAWLMNHPSKVKMGCFITHHVMQSVQTTVFYSSRRLLALCGVTLGLFYLGLNTLLSMQTQHMISMARQILLTQFS